MANLKSQARRFPWVGGEKAILSWVQLRTTVVEVEKGQCGLSVQGVRPRGEVANPLLLKTFLPKKCKEEEIHNPLTPNTHPITHGFRRGKYFHPCPYIWPHIPHAYSFSFQGINSYSPWLGARGGVGSILKSNKQSSEAWPEK